MNANRFLKPGDRVPRIPKTSVASQTTRNEAARITTPFGSITSDQKFAKAIIVPDSAATIVSRRGAPQFPCMLTDGSAPKMKLGGDLWATRPNTGSEICSEVVEKNHEEARSRHPPLKKPPIPDISRQTRAGVAKNELGRAANSRHFPPRTCPRR